jgi:hypothetical protein
MGRIFLPSQSTTGLQLSFRQKKNYTRLSNPAALGYEILSQRIMLAGDLSAPDTDFGTHDSGTQFFDLETRSSSVGIEAKLEIPPARIVINDGIGPAGSREYAEPFDAVVHLQLGCTGTLIAPDVVLTARHCGSVAGDTINFGDNSNAPIYTATVESVFTPAGDGTLLDGGDVEILRLTAAVPANIATPMRLIDATDALEGQLAATVGYGFNGVGSTGHQFTDDGFRWGGENIIDAYGAPASSSGSNIISTDFDDGSAAANTIAGSDPTPLELEATTAPGDSGGPVLVRSGAEWVIAGVLSGGTNSESFYGDISWWTGTAVFRDDIESFGGVFVSSDLGDVRFDAPSYTEEGVINLRVGDNNATGPVTVMIEVSSGDREVLTLTDNGEGTYSGTIESVVSAITFGDGLLQVADDDIITVTYLDADDGNGEQVTLTDTAVVFRDDYGDDAAAATEVGFPLRLVGEIEQAIDQDWFSFNAVLGMQYDFQVILSSLSGATLTLYDSSGTTPLQASADTISWLPTVAGEHFIAVESSSNGLGIYQLGGTETVPQSAVEFASSSFTDTGQIGVTVFEPNSNGPVTVTIEVPSGDRETLTLASIGDLEFTAVINSVSGLAIVGDGTLQVSQGETITVSYADSDDGLGGTSTATDTATIVIDDHGSNSATATLVVVPFELSGELEVDADEDWFSFSAQAGVRYEFETALDTLTDTTLSLYDTDGTTELVFNDDGGAGLASLVNWQAPATGVYFLSVQAFSVTQTGTYQLIGVEAGPLGEDDHGNSSSAATSVESSFNVSGDIEAPSDVDWFSFTADAGNEYQFETTLNTLSDSTLILYGTDGAPELVFNDDGGVGLASLITWQAPESGVYFLSVQGFSTDQTGTYQLAGTVTEASGTIIGRHLFYDGSIFDGDAGVHSANDDNAIATNKSPLLSGTATFANYTNFENGITGLFLDIVDLPNAPRVGDFQFRVGNSSSPSTWPLLDLNPSVLVRFGAGESGSDRVSLIWPAGTIVDQWLEVSVLAGGVGGIVSETDVHYWGNQRGDTGNSAADTAVNSGDVSHVMSRFSGFGSVDPTSDFDLNKDGRVDSGDVSAVSSRFSGFAPTLHLMTAVERIKSDEVADAPKDKLTLEPINAEKVVKGAEVSFADAADAAIHDSRNPQTNLSKATNERVSESGDIRVHLPNTVLIETTADVDSEDDGSVIDRDGALISPTPVELPRVLATFDQPAATTSEGQEPLLAPAVLTSSAVSPATAVDLATRRLERAQRKIYRWQSQDKLTENQHRRLSHLRAAQTQTHVAGDEQPAEIEFSTSVERGLIDAAFSTWVVTDFRIDYSD